jgi:amino acid transporter
MEPSVISGQRPQAARVVVATTVALSFISFWRAAAVVLSDLGSSMFYAGGIAGHMVGASAPWFILGVMLFSFAVRAVYVESSSMFVRGGVYVVVRDAMGPFVARLSVSSLIFDYILTGPISVVSAGLYLAGLWIEFGEKFHYVSFPAPWVAAAQALGAKPDEIFAALFAIAVTIYFWWSNIKGIHESSGKALRIIQITTVMVVVFLIWCPITLLLAPKIHIPPAPLPQNIQFAPEALGWLRGTIFAKMGLVMVVVGFGHSLLSMSGFETLAQVYREIAYPKLKNLKITGTIVCLYSVIATGSITLFAFMIIPENMRAQYGDYLLGGLAMHLAGPEFARLCFHVFVVVVGALILSGAVNTSIIGANGVMNRIAEDGVLVDWFRKPHRRFGTTYRIINLVALLQVGTIALSRGNVLLLGEAYAFGVVWSFFLKSAGVLVLRYHRHDQEYKFPGNLHIGGKEIPVGLGATTIALFIVAIANLFTKEVATVSGVAFTSVFFMIFTVSERINAKKMADKKAGLEEFNLEMRSEVNSETIQARPGCVLVAVRDFERMPHLKAVLEKTNLRRHDIVVMTVRPISGGGAGEYELGTNQLFSDYEKELLSRVVSMAEKEGKHVDLLVVPGVDPFDAMVQTAAKLQASRLVTGVSPKMDSAELARRIGLAWEKLPEPRHPLSLEVITPGRPSVYVNLGPHPPRLWPEDLDRAHELWLELSSDFGARLHHRDVIGVALRRLEKDLSGDRRREVLTDLEGELKKA